MAKRPKSPPGTEHSSDLPESKCDNANLVFLLHDHVPFSSGMNPECHQ
jgi:hypothetical protein